MEWGELSEKGLERDESNKRGKDKRKATQNNKKNTKHKKGIWLVVKQSLLSQRLDSGEIRMLSGCLCGGVCVRAFMFAVLFLAQLCPNKAQNNP